MKKISFLLLLISTSINAWAQNSIKWERIYGGTATDYAYSVRSCPDQGYIVAGSSSTNGITDGYLLRTDTLGMLLWVKYYAGTNVDILRSVRILPDSGYIIAGYSNSAGHGGYDGWLLRTDKNGDTLWTKYIGTPDWDFFYDVFPTSDGGFVLAGGTYGLGAGDEDMYFVKTDMNGDTLWTRTYGGIYEDEARSIYQTGDLMIAACGNTKSLGDTLGDSWILKMDQNGDTAWTRTLGLPNAKDQAWGISNCSTYSRIFIAGETHAPGNADCYIHCLTYAGNPVYTDVIGGPLEDYFNSIVTHADGTSAAFGLTYSYGGGNGDGYFSANRYSNSYTTHGTLQEDKGYGIDTTLDNAYILCGYTTGYSSNLPNVYLVKTDSAGNSSGILSIREKPEINQIASTSVFPNPAAGQVTVSIDSDANLPEELQLIIYDISGRELMHTNSRDWNWLAPQSANFNLDISKLNGGIYYYSVFGSNMKIASGKFIKVNP